MHLFYTFLSSVLLLLSAGTYATADTPATVSVNNNYVAIGEYIAYLQEDGNSITIEKARQAFQSG
jgi:GGDEF domain-containing protein